jgi:hypothetical protein
MTYYLNVDAIDFVTFEAFAFEAGLRQRQQRVVGDVQDFVVA